KYHNSSVIAERWNARCSVDIEDYAIEKYNAKVVFNKYIFPVQFMIAIAGNLLTLAVLLSGTSNRANRLLICLAVCDCLLFLAMSINSIITFESFYVIPAVRLFYYEYRNFMAMLTNWLAAASVWFVLAISVERMLIIKFPFRSLNSNQVCTTLFNRQVVIIAVLIMLITFCAVQVHWFTNYCFAFPSCNGTEIRGACALASTPSDMNLIPEALIAITPTWIIFNTFFVVIIPVAIVIIINISLLKIVKRSNKQELVRTASSSRPRRSDEQERSMTRAIVAIVTCFSVTQGPSGLLHLGGAIAAILQMDPKTQTKLQEMMPYSNALVLTGKMLNFVLFCLTSRAFRVRLLNTMNMWCYKLGVVQRPVLNRKYIYASPTGTTSEKPRASFSRLPTSGENDRPRRDASRSLLTAKSSVASFHWKGRNGQDDSIAMQNGHKKQISSMVSNNNCFGRVNNNNNNNNTHRSSGSRSSQDSSATGSSRPLFMTNNPLEKKPSEETTEM
ncbi:hypothetical protein PMAYCL1PPCAC_15126, partial [Pristionchus mayeri]